MRPPRAASVGGQAGGHPCNRACSCGVFPALHRPHLPAGPSSGSTPPCRGAAWRGLAPTGPWRARGGGGAGAGRRCRRHGRRLRLPPWRGPWCCWRLAQLWRGAGRSSRAQEGGACSSRGSAERFVLGRQGLAAQAAGRCVVRNSSVSTALPNLCSRLGGSLEAGAPRPTTLMHPKRLQSPSKVVK